MLTDCCHNFDDKKCRCPDCGSSLQRVTRNGSWTLLKCTNEGKCDFEFTCGDVTASKVLQPPSEPVINSDAVADEIGKKRKRTP